MNSSSSSGSPMVQPQGEGYGSGSGSQSGAFSTAAAPPPGFIPGNPTDPLPPDPTPFRPGNPTDPFPIPAPVQPVRENAPALLQQADTQSGILTGTMQSVLDELASTIGQSAAQSKAALQQVSNALRSELKTSSVQQANQINQVLGAVANAATSGATMNQALLDGIVSTLAGAPVATVAAPPPGPSPITCPPGQVPSYGIVPGSNPPYYEWQCIPAPQTPAPTQTPTGMPTPKPTTTTTTTAAPTVLTIPPAGGLPTDGNTGSPQGQCYTCQVLDAKGQWVETFNNMTQAQAAALSQQIAALGEGYTSKCGVQPSSQPCGAVGAQPVFVPPSSNAIPPIQPPTSGGAKAACPPNAVTPPSPGSWAIPCQYSYFVAWPSGGGNQGGNYGTEGEAYAAGQKTLAVAPPGATVCYYHQWCGNPPPPTGQPPTAPQPQPSIPPPIPSGPCNWPSLDLANLPQNLNIGSEQWCGNIQVIMTGLSAAGNQIAKYAFANTDKPLPSSVPPVPQQLQTALNLIPFGIGGSFTLIWDGLWCAFDYLATLLNSGFSADVAILQSTVGSNSAVTFGLIMFRAATKALKRIRVGANALAWLTADLTIEWDQAEAVLDYLIAYSSQYSLPTVAEAMRLYRGGWISQGTYNCWMKCNNANPDVFQPVFDADRPRPAVHERQQLLWRQRPGNNNGGPQYTDAMFKSDLAVDGTHPAWNDLLYATRYQRYTIRELRQLMDAGVLTQDDAFHVFQDMGFDDAKANTLAQMEQVLTVRRREQEIAGYTPAKISQFYMRGVMQPTEVTAKMKSLFYTADQAATLMQVASTESHAQQVMKLVNRAENDLITTTETAFKLGRINSDTAKAALVSLGAPDNVATAILSTWDASNGNDNTKQAVAAVKKGWRSGFLPTVQVVDMLQSAGMIPSKASELLSLWQLEVQVDERVQDVSQILASVASGNMDGATAGARLANMGWDSNDSDLLVSEALSKLAKAQAELESKALAAAERAGKAELSAEKSAKAAAERAAAQSAKAAETLAKQALTAQKTARAALLKATPVSKLSKWLRDGMISQEAFIERMVLLGYPAESAALQAEEACHGKGASCVPTAGPDDTTLQNLPT